MRTFGPHFSRWLAFLGRCPIIAKVRQKQIPRGNDRKKSKSKGRNKDKGVSSPVEDAGQLVRRLALVVGAPAVAGGDFGCPFRLSLLPFAGGFRHSL